MSEERRFGPGVPPAIGASLREAREARGLTREAVAGELRLTTRVVEHLEAGAWDRLGPHVYVRGYLRAYGRFLAVDVSASELVLGGKGVIEAATPQPVGLPRRRRRAAAWEGYRRIASYGVATALIAIPVVIFLARAFDGSLFAGDEPATAAPAEPPAGGAAAGSDRDPVPMIASLTGLSARREPAAPGASARVPAMFAHSFEGPPAAAPAPAPAPSVLVLTLSEPVWTDIRDGQGTRLLYGTQPAGTRHRIPLTHGLDVRLGNASAVQATLDGDPFDLGPYLDRDIATFRLAPADGPTD